MHGSTGARWLSSAHRRTVCVTVTEVDGMVLARCAAYPWGGHLPLYRVAGAPVGDEGSRGPVPDDVRRRAEQLGALAGDSEASG